MNDFLEMPFTPEEVEEALTQMCPTKAPGPDGLPAVFYQKHWQTVKQGVLSTCLHILNNQGDVAPLNHTYIALIPKKGKPRKVTNFRPISLCNVIYRIVAKAIANRLKHVLPNIISPMQSAFIPNRLITDNIIVGYECLHKIRHCKGRKNGLVALKLDVSKAYDRLEWEFLEQTMKSLGFSQNWISLIMRCISSVTSSVIVNGAVSRVIRPQRGLRQGCPLSPYLFIIGAEAFSSLLQQAEHQRLIHGLSFGKELKISHLLFADDSLVFTRASVTDCQNLKRIFDCYSAASGQLFNLDKSSMFLSGNIQAGQAATIKDIFQLNIVSRHEKYLGLPSMIGRKRSSFFTDIKLKIHNKVSNWQHKFFSVGGKEVLIKAAAQAIPAYAMSRILQFPDSLVARTLQARYFQHKDFMKASLGSNPSFIWRSILWGRQVISKGYRWRIGNEDALVAELINAEHEWNEGLIHRHFAKTDAEAIVKILLPRRPMKEEVMWHYDRKGQYLVKSGYQIALNLKFPARPTSSAAEQNQWNTIWMLTLPEKIRIFAWRTAKNLLPSAENLWKRKVIQEPVCQFCNNKLETVFHALVGCKVVQKIWKITRFEDDLKDCVDQDILSLLIVKESPQVTVSKAEAVLEAFRRTQIPAATHIDKQRSPMLKAWNPPQKGFYKVNVDAATNSEKQIAGLGAVIRDEDGNVIAAAVKVSKFYGDVCFAEAEAVEWGLQVARNACIKSLIVESDAQEIVKLPVPLAPNSKLKQFRFENMWLREPDYKEIVKTSWNNT
ncbi:reverse transcriptase domain-containing protein [Citrus sinensis]|uniref:Reverse transcriptase domain-containing protein n=1 Tax=Citrus sinensis TaxID=2711 RepID=A0ACB8I393_CITSI|nr:reverse transcriptase domain-containing protein [Citrus sinensis]